MTDYVFTYGYKVEYAGLSWLQDDELLLTITPKRIRSLLRLNQYDLPTERITRSLRRLEGMVVQGKYRVRSAEKAIAYPIHGPLFQLGVGSTDSGKRVQEYVLLFESDWGKAFMHNVRCGNFVKVQDIPYGDLDTGAKQLFYIVMTMPNKELRRTQANLLRLMNIKEKQNKRRGVERLETYIKQLEGYGLINWNKMDDVYRIHRQYNPIRGSMPEAGELRQ